jgi:hypothetical protein
MPSAFSQAVLLQVCMAVTRELLFIPAQLCDGAVRRSIEWSIFSSFRVRIVNGDMLSVRADAELKACTPFHRLFLCQNTNIFLVALN